MIKRAYVGMLAFLLYLFTAGCSQANATMQPVLLYQIQAGASTAELSITSDAPATKEFISIYNNSEHEIDVTDWCLTNKSNMAFACLHVAQVQVRLILPSYTYTTVASESFAKQYAYIPDFMFPVQNGTSGSITGSADIVSLVDVNGTVVDSLEWKSTLAGGTVYQRKFSSAISIQLVDTDVLSDFQKVDTLIVPAGGIVEEVIPVDLCSNIDGVQETIPDGYSADLAGNCSIPVDLCANIAGVQTMVPDGYGLDTAGLCTPDICHNLNGVQVVIPAGYKQQDDGCLLDVPELRLSELLPNPTGDDTGKEYIELYNPNDFPVDLSQYRLAVGAGAVKYIAFAEGVRIEPHGYWYISNDEYDFVLTNTASKVEILSLDYQSIAISTYENAGDNQAWANIEGVWQFTNQPTPGGINTPSLVEVSEGAVLSSALKPCAANQYRNPETNRCRMITSAGTALTPCKDGQYRSEETNRCRNIASDVVSQVPCEDGYERNPETNRCRKIQTVSMPLANFAVTPIPVHQELGIDIYVLAGVIVGGIIYAVWEWRAELVDIWKLLVRRQKS